MRSKINYIWVGKPRSVTVDKPQQDLVGPVNMYLAIEPHTTNIRFWCLEQYVEDYRLLLKDTPIIISPIESFLHEKLNDTDMVGSAKKVIVLVNRVTQDDFRIRACVTAKESFAFFLMAAEGGYVLDTNVLPASNYIEFPEHAVFLMPAYHVPVLSRENDDHADVGIMYSPSTNRAHANRALNFFLKRIGEIDKAILFYEGYSENYKTALIHIVIQAALVCDSDQNQDEIAFWTAKRLGPGFPVLLDEQPRVIKYYANSHGADRGNRSALHDAAATGDHAEVTRLLKTGCLYDETISTMHHDKITPLFAAEFYGNKAIADQLRRQEIKYRRNTASLGLVPLEGFSVGDILIKIDCRARHPIAFNTQHHAMLIIAIDRIGYPLVAHMKFIDFQQQTGTLVIEPCPAAKDLILIHAPAFSSELRDQIAWIARQACQYNQLKINKPFLELENQTCNQYRWTDRFEADKKIRLLRQQSIQATNVIANREQLISCHDFVLSTIHMACTELKEPIPKGLDIPPQFAWSDILNLTAGDDKTLVLSHVTKISPPSRLNKNNADVRFFTPNNITSNPIQETSFFQCLVM